MTETTLVTHATYRAIKAYFESKTGRVSEMRIIDPVNFGLEIGNRDYHSLFANPVSIPSERGFVVVSVYGKFGGSRRDRYVVLMNGTPVDYFWTDDGAYEFVEESLKAIDAATEANDWRTTDSLPEDYYAL